MSIKGIKKIQSVKSGAGFTLMEIMVATVIFAVTTVSLLSLFNSVLKINRRGEALRQAAQDARNFVEFLVKEIRNGQIDYYVNNGSTYGNYINGDNSKPCGPPGPFGATITNINVQPTYAQQSNWLGIINTDNVQECFYYATQDGSSYVGSGKFDFSGGGKYLVMEKSGISAIQQLNPANARVDNLMFLVRPQKDPYTAVGGLAKIQPSVVILIKFVVQLPTGEQVPIYYQTAVSENKYDIPNQ
jgi:prepilin-type N-terminal cleavage/methylation domain-containing protein